MNKIWLIIQREFSTRVKSKAFILGTFLAPLGMIVLIAIVAFIFSRGSDEQRTIAVLDKSNILAGEIKSSDQIKLNITNLSFEELMEKYDLGEIDGVLEIPAQIDPNQKDFEFVYHSDRQLAIDESFKIGSRIENRVRDYKVSKLNMDIEKVDMLRTNISLLPQTIKDTDKKLSSITNIVSGAVGGVISYFMFFLIMVYGGQVMRSVMEEKINRVIEVLISSVKPYQLMLGKIIGVGSVGLLQVTIWGLMMAITYPILSHFIGIDSMGMMDGIEVEQVMSESQGAIAKTMIELGNINWAMIIPFSLIFFLGGYFAYAALFAALGSAVGEDVNEAQTLMFPIMLPLILGIYIAFSAVQAPHSSLATWSSMIPLISSIVMPVRLASSPPFWQVLVSSGLLILFCYFFVWLAGRIYRVGILMYGKKASFKELAKWVFFKG